jgi:hypothetical protein
MRPHQAEFLRISVSPADLLRFLQPLFILQLFLQKGVRSFHVSDKPEASSSWFDSCRTVRFLSRQACLGNALLHAPAQITTRTKTAYSIQNLRHLNFYGFLLTSKKKKEDQTKLDYLANLDNNLSKRTLKTNKVILFISGLQE